MESKPNSSKSPPLDNYKKIIKNVYVKTSSKDLQSHQEILKLIFPEPLVIYKGINKSEKSEKIKIPKGVSPSKLKKIISLEQLKEMMYNFNLKDKAFIKNESLKKENKLFDKNYKLLLKQQNKFSTGTYLDYQSLVDLANTYAQKGKKIPKISVKSDIFKSNPLILSGVDLENYFLYHFANKSKKKTFSFLKKINTIVDKKITRNVSSDEEIKRLESIKENEKPKGYVPLNILIPQLKNDIFKTQATIAHLEKNTKNNNNTNISNISKRKLRLNRSLSIVNYNKYFNRIESTDSTKEQNSKRFAVLNPNISLPFLEYNNKSNINSEMTRNKQLQLFPVRIERKKILNHLKQKLLNSDSIKEIIQINNGDDNKLDNENIYTNNSTNSINSESFKKKILKKNLNPVKSMDLLIPIRRGSLITAFTKDSKQNLINSSENLPLTNIENTSSKNLIDVLDIFKQKENKENNINNEAEKREEEFKKCENIYNSILAGKYQSKRCKSVLSNFLEKRGYNSLGVLKDKELVLNISKIRNKAVNRNFILEEYQIRNRDKGKSSIEEEQESILGKNDRINKKLKINDYTFKKIICERNIEKGEYS